jgi:hypothetical protein
MVFVVIYFEMRINIQKKNKKIENKSKTHQKK